MSSEKKTIQINPDLFQLNGSGKTKKTKPTKQENKIKIKSTSITPAKNNTLKREILRVIRGKQQDEYKRLFSKSANDKIIKKDTTDSNSVDIDTNFNSSLQYFSNLEKKINQENENNQTLRKMPPITNEPIIFNELPSEFNLSMPTENCSFNIEQPKPIPKYIFPQHPGYGCLKGGVIPTYRTIKNKEGIMNIPTLGPSSPAVPSSAVPSPAVPSPAVPSLAVPSPAVPSPAVPSPAVPSLALPSSLNSFKQNNSDDNKNQIMKAEIKHHFTEKTNSINNNLKKIKNMKRKKIYKRTYRVGKSKTAPKIGCLISNKTVRHKIQQGVYELKHTNMKDVRKFLLKKGFIKVGTVAPNDVLRKMYESVATVCGEVQNHNPDNLLYNFMNDKEN